MGPKRKIVFISRLAVHVGSVVPLDGLYLRSKSQRLDACSVGPLSTLINRGSVTSDRIRLPISDSNKEKSSLHPCSARCQIMEIGSRASSHSCSVIVTSVFVQGNSERFDCHKKHKNTQRVKALCLRGSLCFSWQSFLRHQESARQHQLIARKFRH